MIRFPSPLTRPDQPTPADPTRPTDSADPTHYPRITQNNPEYPRINITLVMDRFDWSLTGLAGFGVVGLCRVGWRGGAGLVLVGLTSWPPGYLLPLLPVPRSCTRTSRGLEKGPWAQENMEIRVQQGSAARYNP